jgi:hypothetical protein
MPTRYRLLLVFVSVLVGQSAGAFKEQDQWKPTPAIKRTKPIAQATLFERPDVIVELRLRKSCEMTRNTDVFPPGEPRPGDVIRQYLADGAYPVRINERLPHEPDLATSLAELSFLPRSDSVDLKVGYTYILWFERDMNWMPNAHYRIAHKQMGFELIPNPGGYRVSPIIKGGELDAYDGWLEADLIKLIEKGEKGK